MPGDSPGVARQAADPQHVAADGGGQHVGDELAGEVVRQQAGQLVWISSASSTFCHRSADSTMPASVSSGGHAEPQRGAERPLGHEVGRRRTTGPWRPARASISSADDEPHPQRHRLLAFHADLLAAAGWARHCATSVRPAPGSLRRRHRAFAAAFRWHFRGGWRARVPVRPLRRGGYGGGQSRARRARSPARRPASRPRLLRSTPDRERGGAAMRPTCPPRPPAVRSGAHEAGHDRGHVCVAPGNPADDDPPRAGPPATDDGPTGGDPVGAAVDAAPTDTGPPDGTTLATAVAATRTVERAGSSCRSLARRPGRSRDAACTVPRSPTGGCGPRRRPT